MEELEDILQHVGVKGMKWGKRKSGTTGGKRKRSVEKYHELNKDKKFYKDAYAKNLKRTKGNHHKAVLITQVDARKNAMKKIGYTVAAVKVASKLSKAVKMVASSKVGDEIGQSVKRRGKNIVLAAKRSPIRYVDGRKAQFQNAFDITPISGLLHHDLLQHAGVKGMKWGVVKWRKPSSGSTKPKSGGNGRMKQEWDSLKRERHWKQTLKKIDSMTTKEIGVVGRRVGLENELKRLASSAKEKKEYRLRGKMSDQELNRKVGRLRAKKNLSSQISAASKEQRELGKRITETGGSMLIKYTMTKKLTVGDVYESVVNPKGAQSQIVKTVLDKAVKKYVS